MEKNLISLLLLMCFACNKKKDSTPSPTPAVPQVSVKINGNSASCSSCYSGYQSGGLRGVTFDLGNIGEVRFFCSNLPAAGNYTLSQSNFSPSMLFQKDFVYYKAIVGTMNITSIDTSQGGVVNKLVATFNFKTDTTGGVYYNITEGSINLK